MKLILAVALITTTILPIAGPASAQMTPSLEGISVEQALERRSHHCPKGAVTISARCRGV